MQIQHTEELVRLSVQRGHVLLSRTGNPGILSEVSYLKICLDSFICGNF